MNGLDEIYNEIGDEEVYEPIPRKPEKKSKARTYLQSVIEQIEPYIYWNNETLVKDRNLVWIKMNQLYKKKSDTGIRLFTDWAKDKKLHPMAVVKAINTILCK